MGKWPLLNPKANAAGAFILSLARAGELSNKDPTNTERSRSLLQARAKAVLDDSVTQLSHQFAAVVHDPYHPSSIRSAVTLNEWPRDWIEATLGKIERGGADEAAWEAVRSNVQKGVHDAFRSIEGGIDDRKAETTISK